MNESEEGITHGYHLFLEPEGAWRAKFSSIITMLAFEYEGPSFPPHVTLLSGIPDMPEEDLRTKAETLARTSGPIEISLLSVGMEERYFRSLYARADGGEALMALHARAQDIFDVRSDEPYLPHLSLLYGMYDSNKKSRTAATLENVGPVSFTVGSISLYKTEGGVNDWKKVDEFHFVS